MSNEIMVVNQNVGEYGLVATDTSDDRLVDMWVTRKTSLATQKQYSATWEQFKASVGLPLQAITFDSLQTWVGGIAGSDNTRKVRIACIKSLFAFALKVGYIKLNPAIMLDNVKVKDTLAERILTEEEVMSMIAKTDKARDKVLIRLIYASAGRISEIAALTWADVQPSGDSGQVTLFGKGGKTRAVKLSKATWKALQETKASVDAPVFGNAPVFLSQKGGRLDETMIHRIVKAAAGRAGIAGNVSAHWLRHSHASHALDRGANVALVRDTLGHSSLAVTSRYTHAKPDQSSALHLAI
jgi:site-specific recombinase XerD